MSDTCDCGKSDCVMCRFQRMKEREPLPVRSESDGSVPTKRERLLMEALRSTLIACGVLHVDSVPNGPELLCAAECFCEGEEQRGKINKGEREYEVYAHIPNE